MRILLADPPRKEHYYDLSYPNLGILYLISTLRARFPGQLEVKYLEGHCSLDEHLRAVEEFKPDLYGLSFALWTTNLAKKVLNAVKERFPDLVVICGGPQPTADPQRVLQETRVDACVMGEGEDTMVELATRLAQGDGSWTQIDGLALRGPGGEMVLTPKRAFIKDLDSIPLPAWDLVDFAKYPGMHLAKGRPQSHILVSRGCPFDCNFCSNPVWKYNKPWVRMRSPENIAQEVELLYQRGVREIYMTSDEFNVSIKWSLAVCQALSQLNHRDLYFQCNARADQVTPELAQAFAGINLWLIHLGIESGNPRTLAGIGKKVTIKQIENACRCFKQAGMGIFGFVMLFHAWEEDGRLVWETPADVERTLRFCRWLLASRLIDYMSWQVASPMPGSRLHRLAERYSLLPHHHIDNVWQANMLLPGICAKEINRKLRKGMLIKNYYLVKNGHVNLSHLDRAWRNLRVLLGFRPHSA